MDEENKTRSTDIYVLISALSTLSVEMQTEDGVVSACLNETIERLKDGSNLISAVSGIVEAFEPNTIEQKEWREDWLDRAINLHGIDVSTNVEW